MTQAGVILGTPAYLSPEQARGQVVDKRSDIWAFGLVLYEMLAGRSLFAADTVSDTIAGILQRNPDWAALPAATPPGIARLLKRCLEKDSRRRLRDIGDARTEIEDTLAPPPSEGHSSAGERDVRDRVRPASRRSRWVWWLAGSAVLLAAAVALGWRVRSSESPRDLLNRASFARLTDWQGGELQAAISRDGNFVTFVSDRDGPWDVWVGQIGTGQFRNLTNGKVPELLNPAVRNVAFVPDGSQVMLWVRLTDPARGVVTDGWAVPTLGGQLRPHMDRYAGQHRGRRLGTRSEPSRVPHVHRRGSDLRHGPKRDHGAPDSGSRARDPQSLPGVVARWRVHLFRAGFSPE